MKKRLLLFLITLLPMFANAGDFNGHNYVDLGLPSGKCWATTNYGANTPEGYGTYMDWSNNSAIASQWGAEWTTPSLDDILELENNCTWTWESYNGIKGYKVIGNNGNSIFLPASGYKMMGQSSAKKVGEWAYYWTLTPANGMAYIIMGTSAEVAYGQMNTSMTYLPIRPVTKESQSSQENNSNFDGEGTKNSPYQIKTSSDLTTLANLVNSGNSYSGIYFGLSDNIDMTETNFIPIGNQAHPFSGVFDGNGYVIKGITINSSSEIGLFGCTDGATINDVGIEEVHLDGESNIGGIVGNSQNTTITNCYTRGKTSGNDCVGALVGYSGLGTVIQNCFSSIQHTKANIYGSVGGLVGYNCGTIENCYFYGTINATSFQAWTTGGIVGYNHTSGKVYNCYFIKASKLNSRFDYCGSLNWGQCSGLATFDGSGITNSGTYLYELLNTWVNNNCNQGHYREWTRNGFPSFGENLTSGITTQSERESNEVVSVYDLQGRRLNSPKKGIKIIRFKNGTSKKVVR